MTGHLSETWRTLVETALRDGGRDAVALLICAQDSGASCKTPCAECLRRADSTLGESHDAP